MDLLSKKIGFEYLRIIEDLSKKKNIVSISDLAKKAIKNFNARMPKSYRSNNFLEKNTSLMQRSFFFSKCSSFSFV